MLARIIMAPQSLSWIFKFPHLRASSSSHRDVSEMHCSLWTHLLWARVCCIVRQQLLKVSLWGGTSTVLNVPSKYAINQLNAITQPLFRALLPWQKSYFFTPANHSTLTKTQPMTTHTFNWDPLYLYPLTVLTHIMYNTKNNESNMVWNVTIITIILISE